MASVGPSHRAEGVTAYISTSVSKGQLLSSCPNMVSWMCSSEITLGLCLGQL